MKALKLFLAHVALWLAPGGVIITNAARNQVFGKMTSIELITLRRKLSVDDLLWIIYHHLDLACRAQAVRMLPTQFWIGQVARSEADEGTRLAAMGCLMDEREIVDMALHDRSSFVRIAAAKRLSSAPLIEMLAQSRHVEVRMAYLDKLGMNAPSFYQLLQKDVDKSVRAHAKSILRSQNTKARTESAVLTAEKRSKSDKLMN